MDYRVKVHTPGGSLVSGGEFGPEDIVALGWRDPVMRAGAAVTGNGEVMLPASKVPDDVEDVWDKHYVRVLLDDVEVFGWRIHLPSRERIVSRHGARAVSLAGPWTMAALGEGELGGIVLDGEGGLRVSTIRYFGPQSAGYDDSGWDLATTFGPYTDPQMQLNVGPDGETMKGNPPDYPDEEAVWISYGPLDDGESNEFGDYPSHPAGLWRTRKEVTVAEDNTIIEIFSAWDNRGKMWFAGNEIINQQDPRNIERGTTRWEGRIDAGTYAVYAEVENDPAGRPRGPNPTGLLASIYADGALLAKTDGTWRTLPIGAPEPPGVTPGFVADKVVDEGQDRGAGTGITWGFTADKDSADQDWDGRVNHGFHYVSLAAWILRQLCDWGCEWHMTPSLVLQGFNGQMGTDRTGTVTLAETDDIADSRYDGVGVRANWILARSGTGWLTQQDNPSISDVGRLEHGGEYSTSPSVDAAGRPVAAALTSVSRRQSTSLMTVAGVSGKRPYSDFFKGDVVTAPGRDGTPGPHRVVAVNPTMVGGKFRWGLELEPQ